MDNTIFGEYKKYKLLRDYEYNGCLFHKNSCIYEAINYNQGIRKYYFDRKVGCGGRVVGTFAEIENNPEVFKFIEILTYDRKIEKDND